MNNAVTLGQLLQNSVVRTPERIAVCDGDTDFTYQELNNESKQIAEILKENIRGNNLRIAFLLPKSILSLVSIFGILESGNAYLPLDFEAPSERNNYILKDCGASGLLLPHNFPFETDNVKGRINIGELDLIIFKKNSSQTEEELAYILYTSGSTGKPKGVKFTHENALSFVRWCSDVFRPDEDSVFSSHAPFHFDLSILDIYLSIMYGAKLVLIDATTGKNPRALSYLIESKKITHWYSTPTILKLMLNYGKIERFDHSSLKMILFAGEVFHVEPLRKLTQMWSHARFFNLYGPTETNVCTYYEVIMPIDENRVDPFPIGKVCEHLNGKIIESEDGKSELCIAGPAVTQGYWNNADRNKSAFIFEGGTNWYRTGDVVTKDDDNQYKYVGRIDRMVKKNGFRIELGEIENVLHLSDGVLDAAVLASVDSQFNCTILAYIETKKEKSVDSVVLKNFCLSKLPHYMVPDNFIFLDSLPKTSTDKTDYQALKSAVNGL